MDLDDIGLDLLMPAQFWGARRTGLTCIQRLHLAVLEDALRCVQRGADARTGKYRRLAAEARIWLTGAPCRWGFSCEDVCDSLGVDWASLRKYVEAGIDGRISRRSPSVAPLMRVEQPDRRVR